jgi:uncharacterized protein
MGKNLLSLFHYNLSMLIGVMSDTHNNSSNLLKALEIFRKAGVETLFHLGDITRPDMAAQLNGFRIIHTVGNGDYLSGEIRNRLLEMNPENFSGMVFTGEIGGERIAATHGHLPGKVEELARSAQYRFVLHGHSHRRRDEKQWGARIVNPGALGGLHPQERSIAILDLAEGRVMFVTVAS